MVIVNEVLYYDSILKEVCDYVQLTWKAPLFLSYLMRLHLLSSAAAV